MQDDSRKGAQRQAEAFGPDTIEGRMRMRIRETIEAVVEEELEVALGAEKSARVGAGRQVQHARAPAEDGRFGRHENR